MTKSSTTPTSDLSSQQSPRPASGRSWFLLVLIFRLLLLGVGGSLAALVGVAIAQFYPSQQEDPPLVEKVIESSQTLWSELKRLPQTWTGTPEAAPPTSSVITVSPPSSPSPSAIPDAERKQLQNELTQLQAELQTLTQSSTKPIEDRIQPIQKRIQAIQQRLDAFTATPATPSPTVQITAPAANTQSDKNQLMVTLPSDALFTEDHKTLRPGTEAILDSIIGDLKRYPDATIRVSAHTDQQGSAEGDRSLSFEQAKAIEQYLAGKLGDGFHWATLGYGHSRPLGDSSTPVNRQRNRRIEIAIDPR